MPAHVSQHLEPTVRAQLPLVSVDAHLLSFGVAHGSPGVFPADLGWLIYSEEELQNCLVGDATDNNHRDGDHLEHVGVRRPERSVCGTADPHSRATKIGCHIQQEDGSSHG